MILSGSVPEWLFFLALAVAVPTAFAAGYYWCGVVRYRRAKRRLVADAERTAAGSAVPVDATRFTE